jgi:hypothetical protein
MNSSKFKKFCSQFEPFLIGFSLQDILDQVQKEWRKYKLLKENDPMMLFLIVDEVALINNSLEIDSFLTIIKEDASSREECSICKIISSISPAAIFPTHKDINKIYPSKIITRLVTGTQFIWYPLPKLTEKEDVDKFIENFKKSQTFNKFDDKKEAEKYLEFILKFSGGHFRTIQKYAKKMSTINHLNAKTIVSVIDITFPLVNSNLEKYWKWIALVILQLDCKLGERLHHYSKSRKGLVVRSFIHNGFLIPKEEIEDESYFDDDIDVSCYSTVAFLYSYSKLIIKTGFSEDFKRILSLLQETTLLSLTHDDPKAFEEFVASHICLLLQLLSSISASNSSNHDLETGNDFDSLSRCHSISLKDLFKNTLIPATNMNIPEIKFSLLNGAIYWLFNVDKDSCENRSLCKRFTKDTFNLNTFYLSSFKNEKGIEGIIGLKTVDDKTIYILLQCKLNYELSKEKGEVPKDKINKALENGINFQKEMNKLKQFGKNFKIIIIKNYLNNNILL